MPAALPRRPVRTAIVGLGFGAEFIPIHQRHPHAQFVAICQRSRDKLDQVGKAYGVERRYPNYADVLNDKDIDAVHINSPIPDHGPMSVAALEAGKHVMCTVPMATSLDDCRKIVELSAKTGLKYMMAETVVYAREFLFIKQMAGRGDLGRIQFVQASHQQDMDGWPNYWPGLPPMHYATHCVFSTSGSRSRRSRCSTRCGQRRSCCSRCRRGRSPISSAGGGSSSPGRP
jgi:predicted dehydrogenase